MSMLQLHSLESAPSGSAPLLQSSIANFGWIPNQSAYMAESPALLEAYQRAHDLFIQSSLDETEKAVVWITAGLAYGCDYTVRAHASIARSNGVPAELVGILADGKPELTPRLQGLRAFARHVATCKGRVDPDEAAAFLETGFTRRNMLDVILGVSQKTMSTLLNSVAGTEIDARFSAR